MAEWEAEEEIYQVFDDGFDRFAFPGNIHRVTAGHGGEALLIIGSSKTALLDCGMAYCGPEMVQKLKKVLEDQGCNTLDHVILSHSHYDHIGALPYVREAFPGVSVYGSRRCQEILLRPNARKLMRELGTAARDLYMPGSNRSIPVETLSVDTVLEDGDTLSLGKETLMAIETKGHTDCSMTFALEPLHILFTSESTGILEGKGYVHTPILKDFRDALVSAEKCSSYPARYICLPHFGMLPQYYNQQYWQEFQRECDAKLAFVQTMKEQELNMEEMLDRYLKRYWTPAKEAEQPKEAYVINSKSILKAALKALL